MSMSQLDSAECIKTAFDDTSGALKVASLNGLITVPYNEVDLTYLTIGNGAGQIGTVIYKNSGSTVATLVLVYDSSNRLSTVTKS